MLGRPVSDQVVSQPYSFIAWIRRTTENDLPFPLPSELVPLALASAAPTGYVYPFSHPALSIKLVGRTGSYTSVMLHPKTIQFALAFAGLPVGCSLYMGVVPAVGGWVMIIAPAGAVIGMVK